MKIWDSEEPGGPGIVRRILQPQMVVTSDEGKPVFVYGVPPENYLPFIGAGLIGLFVLGKLLLRLRRK